MKDFNNLYFITNRPQFISCGIDINWEKIISLILLDQKISQFSNCR